LPHIRIVFISIKPSVLRRPLWAKMRQANRLIQAFCRSDEHLAYADVATPMLDDAGSPRRDLFAPDGLHLNGEGYRLWTGVVSPIVERAFSEP
jgi:lysophospholipase L1-like esterase